VACALLFPWRRSASWARKRTGRRPSRGQEVVRASFALGWLVACILFAGCAKIPAGSYGVSRLKFEGVEQLDQGALRACLVTEERKRVTVGFTAFRSPECGKAPFDRVRLAHGLYAWPWSSWPVYDEAVFKRDLERLERWYQARGYYGVHVQRVSFDPAAADDSEIADCGEHGCPVDIVISVHEGEPVRIRHVDWRGLDPLPRKLRNRVRKVHDLEPGQIFDEALYDAARGRVAKALGDAGYARARVKGDVVIDRAARSVDLAFDVDAGNECRVGNVRVEAQARIPHGPVLAASRLKRGALYDEEALEDAQRSIYAMGAFSAVTVRGELDKPGDDIDIVIEVEPRRESQWMLGGGMLNGVLTTGIIAPEWVSVPQWDLHLTGSYENRNFFGGLRRLRIEERPRMLFLATFPEVPSDSPRFGNLFRIDFAQPAVLEARTTLRTQFFWDNGPDPFLLFFRNSFGISVGLERGFLKQRLQTSLMLHEEYMLVAKRQPIVDDAPSSYELPYLEQRASLDFRNDSANPDHGAYFSVAANEAFKLGDRAWNYLRFTPDARGYVPLGLGIVLAMRFAIGWIHVFKAGSKLDPESQVLGPQNYRLRGGGAQSNRGFAPGTLGDGRLGGIRRWESSVELRVPVTHSFSIALFTDLGNVSATPNFGFYKLNTAIGGGLRYRTIVGPVRFDVGWRPPKIQTTNGTPGSPDTTGFFGKQFQGAVQITVGEPF
jgi:outer membrane protein assembly factor BamA